MRIAITGIGAVSAIGLNCTQTLDALLKERSGIAPMRYLQSIHCHLPVGEVPCSNEELRAQLQLGTQPLPRTSLLGITAAKEALTMAHIQTSESMAFISGTTVGGMDLTEQHWHDYAQGEALEYIHLHQAGESTKAIARQLGTFGYICTPSTACSSALNAIILGANLIRTGQVKQALVGGSESLSRFHLNGFNTLLILDSQPCRPFDADRKGLNLGEGAGYIVLEEESEAIARGAHIIGYIAGYANACDAYHQTASSENGEGAYLAMTKALEMAHIAPQEIDYINAHGTATPNNDLSESAALKRVFGNKMPYMSSTKAFTGHTTSASGGLETVICLLAMQHHFVPANLNWTRTQDGLVIPTPHTTQHPLHYVLCNAFGFGGNESSLILSDRPVDLSTAPFNHANTVLAIGQTDDSDISSYISPAESRRMTPQTRRLVTAAKRALEEAEISTPDAIICATQYGSMLQSMRFLQDMINSNEQQLKPTPFIQSTHNTLASLIAIITRNHGYNSTYSQEHQSLQCAFNDAETQMSLGLIKNALILEFDEQTEAWDNVLKHINEHTSNIARAYILTANNKQC